LARFKQAREYMSNNRPSVYRNRVVGLLSDKEYIKLMDLVEENNVSVSEYIRAIIVDVLAEEDDKKKPPHPLRLVKHGMQPHNVVVLARR